MKTELTTTSGLCALGMALVERRKSGHRRPRPSSTGTTLTQCLWLLLVAAGCAAEPDPVAPPVRPDDAKAQTVTTVSTLIPHQSLGTYLETADVIVRATLEAERGPQRSGAQRLPHSELTLEVHELMKGEADEVIVDFPVVDSGPHRVRVEGAPELALGDECIFFLKHHGDHFVLLGLGQGTYRVDQETVRGLHADELPVADFTATLRMEG